MTDKSTALVPEEGWHCLHLFYRLEYGQWQLLSREEQNAAKTNLSSLVQEVRARESTQLLTLSMVTPKADIGFMLITPDLHSANKIEKQLSLSLGGDVLTIHHDRRRIRADPRAGAKPKAGLGEIRGSDEFVSRAHEKIPAGPRVSHAARLAGGLLL